MAIRVYRDGKLTDIEIIRRSSVNSYLGPEMPCRWDEVVIVDDGEHFKPATRYSAMDCGKFYYYRTVVSKDPVILLQETLLT